MEFNVEPYYDDFEENALDNNYVRILFKPGQAVQARELTQIQSILQNQIKQFGDHIFQDGSPVIGGNLTLDNKVKYVKLEETFNNEDVDISLFDGKIIRSLDGLVQAKVLTTYFPPDGIPTLLVRYITGNEFSDASVIKIAGTNTQARAIASSATGFGLVCSINQGVFYVDGFFVQVENQTTVVSAYDTSANVKIGLEISEDLVDSVVDTSLLDPAQGSFNYQAPGADRYQFNLNLSTRPLNANVDESKFFELMRVENGAITKQVKYPVYAELEKTLARRTFDESGDYTVKPFRATIKDDVDTNNYVVSVEPGKAYVKGFEFETLGTLKVVVPKPRSASDVKTIVDTDIDTSYGNFIYVTSPKGTSNGLFNIAALEKIDVHVGGKSEIYASGAGNGTANAFLYANTKIGTVRVKNFARHVSDVFNANVDTNGIYKLYITDVVIQPKVLKVNGASAFANTINLSTKFAFNVNNYTNVSVTILPVRLDAVANVNTANVIVNSYRLNANSVVASVFTGNVSVGSTIRVSDMVRRVVSVNAAGDYLTVNRAWDKTIIGTSSTSNPLEVLVQSNYTQNVSTQTRKIISGANTAGNLVFTLDRDFNDSGKADANTVVQFNFGIKDAKSFCSGPVVANTLATNANLAIDVSSLSKLVDGSTVVQDIERNKLIFRLPGNHVKKASINNTDYIHSKLILDRSNTGNPGEFTIAQGSGLETFETIPWADSTSAIQDNLIFIVRNNNGNTSFPNGSVIQLTSANVSLSGSPTDTITIDTQIGDILKADIILNVKENDAEDKLRTKVFMSNTTYVATPTFTYPTSNSLANVTVSLSNLGEVAKIDVANGLIWLTNPGYNAVYPGDSISLFVPDVVRIRKVFASNTTTVPQGDANTVDITNNFLIDYGQRDDRYEHAKLVLKTGYDSPNKMLLVHADFYQHIYAVGTNVSFFSADSYSDAIYNSESVPIYRASTGEVYYLRDCLDFRPTQAIGDTSTAFTVPNIPTPDETTELSFEHYLPRIDKLVLSKDKEFRVITGRSALKPYPPADLDDAMTLYTISVPPYAADLSRFKIKYVDHRRLTMRDLANLQKRVESLEYYTSFNNTELLALSDKTTYEDGTEKEKYGIVGENFKNFNIVDYKSPDFNVALDGGFMIPSMRTYTNQFTKKTTTSTKQNKKTITLNYTETPAITQGLVSNNAVSIQPFLFGSFNGTLELTPETDFWINENLKPEVISVPERIIEIHTVITETIREPIQPVTIINNYPVTNVTTIITTTPGVDPTPPPGPPPPPPANTGGTVVGTTPVDPPPQPPPPPPIYNCPAPWMMIQLLGGESVPVGELKPGMFVETYHEHTQKFGAYEVTHVESVQDAKRVQIKFDHVDFVCSYDHKFYKDGDWITVSDLVVGDVVGFAPNEYKVLEISEYDTGEVMRITVDDAHTYICEGILSHNKTPPIGPIGPIQPPLPPPPGPPPIEYGIEIDPCFCFGAINFSGGGVSGSSSCYNYTLVGLNSAIPAYEGELVGAYCSGGGFYNFGGISDGIIYPTIVYPVEAPPAPVESTIPDATAPIYVGNGPGMNYVEFTMDDSGTGGNAQEYMAYDFMLK